VPENEEELRAEIEQTREQLGQTVEQLAAKTDVKARARAKAAELTGRVKGKTAQARATAADRAIEVRGQIAGKSEKTRQKAAAAGSTAKTQVQARTAPVREATPEPVRRAVAKGARTANQRRVPLAVAAAALIAGYLALRWWRKR
jgi:cobalamin biosynthesis Mg chelatase CobN